MKDKILILIIGMLIGAIIATVGFLVYTKVNEKSNVNNGQMMMRGNGERPTMPQDMQNGENSLENFKKSRKQNDGNQNEEETSIDTTANSKLPEMPNGEKTNGEAPNGEMPTGTRPEMPNENFGNFPEIQKQNGEA